MWERSYTVHWYRHILVWYWTSWQLNHLNRRKRWRPCKCRSELLFWECRKQPLVLSSGRNYRMDHSGAKKKVSCTKDSTQASAPTGLCLLAYLHYKFQYISDLRDRQTRGSSSGKLHLSSPKTEYYKQSFEYFNRGTWEHPPAQHKNAECTCPFC